MSQCLPQSNVAIPPLFEHGRAVADKLSPVRINADIEPIAIQIEISSIGRLVLLPPRILYDDRVRRSLLAHPLQKALSRRLAALARRVNRERVGSKQIRRNGYCQCQNKDEPIQECALPKSPGNRD